MTQAGRGRIVDLIDGDMGKPRFHHETPGVGAGFRMNQEVIGADGRIAVVAPGEAGAPARQFDPSSSGRIQGRVSSLRFSFLLATVDSY